MSERGALIAVVGPSGAGKDTLINAAKTQLRGDRHFSFPRRFITRPENSGTELHIALTVDEFARKRKANEFAISWEAHGLKYAIPIEVTAMISAGRHVIVNISRGALEETVARFGNVAVIHVTAPPELLARRLAARKREDADDVRQRLDRSAGAFRAHCPVVEIANTGSIDHGTDLFVQALNALSQRSPGENQP